MALKASVFERSPAEAWNPVSSLQLIPSSPLIGALKPSLSYDLIGHLFYPLFYFSLIFATSSVHVILIIFVFPSTSPPHPHLSPPSPGTVAGKSL